MFKKFFLGTLLLITLVPAARIHAAPCTISGGAVNFPTGSSCEYEPNTYSITLYQLGLCTSAPVAPTPTAAANLASCTTTYNNPSGLAISVSSTGAPVALTGGTITIPPGGTYTHGYAIISNTIGIATSVTFTSSRNGQVSGSGAVCWTANLNQTVFSGSNSTSECGSSAGSVGTINLTVDTFDLGALTYNQTRSVVGTNDLNVYILEPSGVSFANGTARSGVANRILGIQAFASPVTIAAQGAEFCDVAFKSSTGLTIIDAGGGAVKFSGGPFAVKVTAK